jgi:hypothetical protein
MDNNGLLNQDDGLGASYIILRVAKMKRVNPIQFAHQSSFFHKDTHLISRLLILNTLEDFMILMMIRDGTLNTIFFQSKSL